MTTAQVAKWELLELVFRTAPVHENPFAEVRLTLDLRCGEQECAIDGFYDGLDAGKEVFRARFAPMHEGVWSWKTRSDCGELDGKEGSFLCAPATGRGPLALNPRFPNWFFRADGSPLWVVNDGWYPHPLFGGRLGFEELEFGSPSEEDIHTYLRLLGEHGVNMTMEVDQLYARSGPVTDRSFNWPWAPDGSRPGAIDRERFNLDYYRRMDRTLRRAQEEGVFYWMGLLFDNSVFRPREWEFHPLNDTNGGWLPSNAQGVCWPEMTDLCNSTHTGYMERYMAYTVARFSAYWNVCWALGAESGNLTPQYGDRIARWYTHWGRYVALRDPHARLQSVGDTGEVDGLVQSPYNQAVITQEHTSMEDGPAYCEAIRSFGERFWRYGRPVLIGEQDRGNCGRYDAERKGYWTAFASGLHMGRVDRHFRPAEKGACYESKLFCGGETPPIYEDLQRMRQFVERSGIRYWRMAPCTGALEAPSPGVFCLGEDGEEYLLYFSSGGAARFKAPACTAVWYNPRDGSFGDEQHRAAGETVFTAPDGEDWVLYLRRKK